MAKTAIITGITGQDGSHLADLLLTKGYKVIGITRRVSSEPPSRMPKHLWSDVTQVSGDLLDSYSIESAIKEFQPDEFYNLAAQSHVGLSWQQPEITSQINLAGTLNCLKAIAIIKPDTKFYQASTSEMFGKVQETPQKETTPFYPRSPYAIAKLAAHWLTINYRESFDMFTACGILFNHEGPRRAKNFVTRKISSYVAQYHLDQTDMALELGNLNSERDWGYAPDYVDAMWRILQQEKPNDYVIGTGENRSVKNFADAAFKAIGVTLEWSGTGLDESAIDTNNGKQVVKVNESYYRPAEVETLLADPSKAKRDLDWQPTVKFEELVEIMVQADIKHYTKNSTLN